MLNFKERQALVIISITICRRQIYYSARTARTSFDRKAGAEPGVVYCSVGRICMFGWHLLDYLHLLSYGMGDNIGQQQLSRSGRMVKQSLLYAISTRSSIFLACHISIISIRLSSSVYTAAACLQAVHTILPHLAAQLQNILYLESSPTGKQGWRRLLI